jgi:hypothetical protein
MTSLLLRLPLLGLLAVSAQALDQLDIPTAMQWYTPLRDRPVVRVGAAWGAEQDADVREQDATLARQGGFASVTGRAWRGADSEIWLRATGVDLRVAGEAQLPASGRLPDRLQDLRIGGFWRMVLTDQTIIGIDADISSPSDRPFSGSDVLAGSATVFSRIPTTGRDAWILVLRYDSTNTLMPGAPLPSVGYQWLRPGLMATLGLPFANIVWRPIDDWSLSANYFPIDAGNASVAWSPGTKAEAPPGQGGPWTVSGNLSVSYENWLLAERENTDERLTFRTVRAFLAGEWSPVPGNRVRLAVGRILLREIYEADSWGHRDENRIRIDPSWFTSIGLQLGW